MKELVVTLVLVLGPNTEVVEHRVEIHGQTNQPDKMCEQVLEGIHRPVFGYMLLTGQSVYMAWCKEERGM